MFKLPGYSYSMKVEADVGSETEARTWIRNWMQVKRLPWGTEVWQDNAGSSNRMAQANRAAGFNAETDF